MPDGYFNAIHTTQYAHNATDLILVTTGKLILICTQKKHNKKAKCAT